MLKKDFLELTRSKIVILDGSTGRNLQQRGMPVGVCPEQWILENPEVLIGLQREFLEAGSDIILAPTFTANRIKLAEYGLEERIEEINKKLVALSREAINQFYTISNNDRKVYVAADLSMTGEQVQPLGKISFEELVDIYKEQLRYQLEAGIDLIFIETMMSLQETRAALLAAKEVCELPVMVSFTFEKNGRTLYGTDPKTAVIVMQSMGADAIGVNCSTGPDKMRSIVREMKAFATIPIIAKPNAGLPALVNGETVFPMEAEEFAAEMAELIKEGANIIGGCCGTTVEHIRQMVDQVADLLQVPAKDTRVRALTTEQTTVEIPLEGRFLVVGERINPTGKKALQEKLRAGDLSLVAQMAEEQAALGADILDVNMGMNGIDEKEMMLLSMNEALYSGKLPISIDSSHVPVMEAALRLYPGRALINSISLEKEKFEKLIPIAKKYGAMFILLPLSEQGLPKDLAEKKSIIHQILDRAFTYGLEKEDIIVDGLVNTVGANKDAALEAIQTIRYCKEELGLATIVGLSNISFGLPERQFINSTFLSFAIQAGLTMAIANPSQDLLMNTAFAADLLKGVEHAAGNYIDRVTARPVTVSSGMPEKATAGNVADGSNSKEGSMGPGISDEKQAIYQAVLKGNKKSIISLVEAALNAGENPGDLIDQTLIPAITEVGNLYDKQIYFLPQLITGAEAMKTAIDYLEPLLKRDESDREQITIVIATVAGDIHDIGKNLVTLMLKNYGFRVIDLGKDVPTDKIIQTAKEENADFIALSALMTTTMVEMAHVVELAKAHSLRAQIIIGGAVVTDSYREEIGADGYSEDAQSAVALVKRLTKKL